MLTVHTGTYAKNGGRGLVPVTVAPLVRISTDCGLREEAVGI